MTLREKVARAICQEKCAFRGEPACWKVLDDSPFTFPPETCCEPGCVAEADAAISVCMEEAATIIERRVTVRHGYDKHSDAAVIRAMIPKEPTA